LTKENENSFEIQRGISGPLQIHRTKVFFGKTPHSSPNKRERKKGDFNQITERKKEKT
jgi:hypothetical protein